MAATWCGGFWRQAWRLALLAPLVLSAQGSPTEPPYGWVDLEIRINAAGRAELVVVKDAVPDYRFEQLAIEAAMEAQFPVRKQNDEPIAYVGNQRIEIPRQEPASHEEKLGQVDTLIRSCRYPYAEHVLQATPSARTEGEQREEQAREIEIDMLRGHFDVAVQAIDGLLDGLQVDSYTRYELIMQKLWALLKSGQAQAAESAAEQYLDQVPVPIDWKLHYLRVVALAELGRHAEAVDLLVRHQKGEQMDLVPKIARPDGASERKPLLDQDDAGPTLLDLLQQAKPGQPMDWLALAFGEYPPFETFRIQGLQPVVRVAPKYPRSALRRNQQGRVLMKVDIDVRGMVTEARVVEAEPPGVFDQASLEAIRQWRFKPAIQNCRPVPHTGVQPLHFSLH